MKKILENKEEEDCKCCTEIRKMLDEWQRSVKVAIYFGIAGFMFFASTIVVLLLV